jgi:HNH endonuclease
MFVRAKLQERLTARRLRAEGHSLRYISRELGVALSSVSVWTRGIAVPTPPTPPVAIERRPGPQQVCGRCHRTLEATEFHRGQSQCKECRREYMRQRGDLHRVQSRRARDKRRAIARAYITDLLRAGVCTDCGLTDPAVLEFDHVGPKWMEVGKLVREAYRLSRIKEEIENCELVCANCHRRRTALRARAWRVDPEWRTKRCIRPLRRRNRLFLLEYLGSTPCVDCGEADPVVLDFDHVGTKRYGVVQLADRETSIASLEREIAECQVRCANCHRRRTIVQQGHFRHHLITPP